MKPTPTADTLKSIFSAVALIVIIVCGICIGAVVATFIWGLNK